MLSQLPILRGVIVHAQPHSLERPGRTVVGIPAARGALAPSYRSESVENAAPGLATPACVQAFAQGRKEGYAAGRAGAVAEEQQSLQADLHEARTQAVEEGRLQGLRNGCAQAEVELEQAQAQAMERAQLAVAHRLERLDAMLLAVAAEAAQRRADAEDDLIALGHEAICRILGSEAATPAAMRSMVRHLLAAHGPREQLAVHVHPDDLAELLHEAGRGDDSWRWVGDKSVQLGGLILRSPEGSLDARLETQLAALREALLTVRRNRKGVGLQDKAAAQPSVDALK